MFPLGSHAVLQLLCKQGVKGLGLGVKVVAEDSHMWLNLLPAYLHSCTEMHVCKHGSAIPIIMVYPYLSVSSIYSGVYTCCLSVIVYPTSGPLDLCIHVLSAVYTQRYPLCWLLEVSRGAGSPQDWTQGKLLDPKCGLQMPICTVKGPFSKKNLW